MMIGIRSLSPLLLMIELLGCQQWGSSHAALVREQLIVKSDFKAPDGFQRMVLTGRLIG